MNTIAGIAPLSASLQHEQFAPSQAAPATQCLGHDRINLSQDSQIDTTAKVCGIMGGLTTSFVIAPAVLYSLLAGHRS